jgi:hypothetical protein
VQITITAAGLTRGRVNEGSAFTATANFFSDAWVATAPTNAQYRLDRVGSNQSGFEQITDWTSLTPATAVSVPLSASQNAIRCDYNRDETRQLTVRGDNGLAGQAIKTLRYSVTNLAGMS